MLPPVVPVSWLHEHADDVALVDVRWYLDGRSGHAAYLDGHLPGARFLDLDRWLAGDPAGGGGRHPLPDAETFAEGMRRLGLDDGDPVVAYDDAGGVIAARLVWMLRVTGHEAALLDGGIGAWTGERATGEEDPPVPGGFTARAWPAAMLADIEDVSSSPTGRVVLDARNPDRYRGDQDPVDPRPGHVPGARNLPCRANLRADGTFLPVDALRRRFAAVGVDASTEVISYCGSGVTACHNLLALELAGYAGGRLYPGSWSEYSRTSRPAETGDDPTTA
jgi:thiosulfate/3-mercaptopyruvate sulfurtransferase